MELLSQINMNCKKFPPYAPLSDYNVFHILGISANVKLPETTVGDVLKKPMETKLDVLAETQGLMKEL